MSCAGRMCGSEKTAFRLLFLCGKLDLLGSGFATGSAILSMKAWLVGAGHLYMSLPSRGRVRSAQISADQIRCIENTSTAR